MRYLYSTFFLSFVIMVSGCKHEPFLGTDYSINDVVEITDICDEDTVYFQNTILPILISNCSTSGCHDVESAEDGVVLVDYGTVMSTGEVEAFDPNDSEIYEVITEDEDDDDFMPPSPNLPLTDEQVDLIYTWINQGALNNSCASSCDENVFTFALGVQPIINLRCKGCHSGGEPAADLALINYEDVQSLSLDGILMDVLLHGEGDFADMPPSGGQISDCEIQVIQNWIDAGALDN